MSSNSFPYSAATSDVKVRMVEAQVSTSCEAEVNRPENTKKAMLLSKRSTKIGATKLSRAFSSKLATPYMGINSICFLKIERNTERTIKCGTAMAYLAAIVNMYQQQVKIGVNNQPHPRKAYIQLLDNMKFNDEHVHRAENQDRGLGTMVDGYKKETDISSIVSYYFSRSSGGDLRNAVSFLLSHFCMLRGEPARKAEFADLQTVILDREEPSECPAFILTLKQGKTNQFGRVELAAYLRNTKVDIYLFIALGFYFFWRWHVDGESFPSIETSDSWFSHKLLRSGQDSTREMTYSTHLEAINRAFKACGIVPTAKTHPARGSSARMADMSGADEADIRRQDRWNSSTMNGAYLTNLPRGAMRTMAGFPSSEGWFYLPRAQDLVWCLPVDSSRTWIPGASEAIKNHFSSGFCANDEKNSRASIVVACYIR